MDELKPIWDKIDSHGREINDLMGWRQTSEYRVGQMESRFDALIKDNARAFGELNHGIKEVSKEVSEIHSEQMRQMGRMEAKLESDKQAIDYKRWILPAIVSIFALLAALGIINGPSI